MATRHNFHAKSISTPASIDSDAPIGLTPEATTSEKLAAGAAADFLGASDVALEEPPTGAAPKEEEHFITVYKEARSKKVGVRFFSSEDAAMCGD